MNNPHKIILQKEECLDDLILKVLQDTYNNDPVLKKRADEIHISRLMEPPACFQCMVMAARQLGYTITAEITKPSPTPPPSEASDQ